MILKRANDKRLIQRFSKQLQETRREQCLTPSELGKLTGLTERAIRCYESGRAVPSVIGGYELAAALGTSVERLITGDNMTITRTPIASADTETKQVEPGCHKNCPLLAFERQMSDYWQNAYSRWADKHCWAKYGCDGFMDYDTYRARKASKGNSEDDNDMLRDGLGGLNNKGDWESDCDRGSYRHEEDAVSPPMNLIEFIADPVDRAVVFLWQTLEFDTPTPSTTIYAQARQLARQLDLSFGLSGIESRGAFKKARDRLGIETRKIGWGWHCFWSRESLVERKRKANTEREVGGGVQ